MVNKKMENNKITIKEAYIGLLEGWAKNLSEWESFNDDGLLDNNITMAKLMIEYINSRIDKCSS